MEGLSSSGNIQGCPADALIAILKSESIGPAIKWVDDFIFFRTPSSTFIDASGTLGYSYPYDLDMVMKLTDPLGIPWHPINTKGQDFRSTVPYLGFVWDLELHSVSLSPKKRLKYLSKVRSLLHTTNSLVSQKDCMSILGTLQHLSFVYKEGRSTLPPFSAFLAKFPNDFSRRHATKPIYESLRWWEAVLTKSDCSRSLKPRQPFDPDLWVDASTNWGIGIIFGDNWYAWALTPGWKTDGRDIGWAESVALELAVLILVDRNFHDCSVIIRSDNTGVIGAYEKGRSRNIPRNDSIRRISSSIVPNNIMIVPTYIASTLNRADPISRGILGPPHLRAVSPPALPPELSGFLRNV